LKNKAWLATGMTKSEVEAAVSSGQPGDFLVRTNKGTGKHYLVVKDGPQCNTYSITAIDDKTLKLANKSADSLVGLVVQLIGQVRGVE
jgi:hypothetical protein